MNQSAIWSDGCVWKRRSVFSNQQLKLLLCKLSEPQSSDSTEVVMWQALSIKMLLEIQTDGFEQKTRRISLWDVKMCVALLSKFTVNSNWSPKQTGVPILHLQTTSTTTTYLNLVIFISCVWPHPKQVFLSFFFLSICAASRESQLHE